MFFFFGASTHVGVFIDHAGVSVKSLLTTRWIAHHSTVKSVKEMFDECVVAIESLCDPHENVDTRYTSQGILPAVCYFTFPYKL